MLVREVAQDAGVDQDRTLQKLAVLNADVSGSTRLYEQFGDEVARADIALCLALLGEVAARHGGRVLQTIGDEVVCGFPAPAHAAAAAGEMHEALRTASAAGRFSTGTLRVKIGWHYGLAEWRGDALVGATPVIAQQVIGLAKPEEVLASGAAIESLPAALRAGAQFIDTVEAQVDGTALAVYRLPWEEDDDVTQFRVESAPARAAAGRKLTLRYGTQEICLDEHRRHCRIGRTEDNDLVTANPFTSRQHAEITFRHSGFHLADNSINGTLISPQDGASVHLHHEEGVLSGTGVLVFGIATDKAAQAIVSYRCE